MWDLQAKHNLISDKSPAHRVYLVAFLKFGMKHLAWSL